MYQKMSEECAAYGNPGHEDQHVSVLSTEELATISDGEYVVTPKVRRRSRSLLARPRSNKDDGEPLFNESIPSCKRRKTDDSSSDTEKNLSDSRAVIHSSTSTRHCAYCARLSSTFAKTAVVENLL